MATYKPLQSIQLTTDTTTVTFSGIPQDYTDLEIVISARCSHSSNSNFYYRVNGDTSSSYSVTRLQGNGSTAVSNRGSSNTVGYIGYTDAADSSSSIFGNTKIYVNNYSNSTNYKTLISKGATPGTSGYAAAFVNLYRGSTSPITSISFTPDAGNWVAGSTFDLYGIKSGTPKAFGGDLVTTDGNYWYHTFNSTQTFTPLRQLTVDYLVVAGGGGGNGNGNGVNQAFGGAGGGGAGGLRSTVTASGGSPGTVESAISVTAQAYTITVGAGGVGALGRASTSTNGTNSVFSTITSTGGGGVASSNGQNGGSGGGASDSGSFGNGTANQGFNGGAEVSGSGGGGGGGAGIAGTNATSDNGGSGGNGVATSISGSSVTYAGGGGGSGYAFAGGTGASGGTGGGGNGASGNNNGGAGTANTGGGGGGASQTGTSQTTGGNGGSGVVIVRYPV